MSALPSSFLTTPLAHRALHDRSAGLVENSRAAIRAAIDHGYGIEIDLQLSRDDQAMVFHDYDLDRLTGETGHVRDRDAAELMAIALTGGDEGIPTFAEVLALVDGCVPLLVELKDQHGALGQSCGTLERAVAQDLTGYEGDLALMSFNPNMVATLAECAPDWPRGIVTCNYTDEEWKPVAPEERARLLTIPDYGRAGACFVSHDIDDLQSPHLARLKRDHGAHILTWTVRSAEAEAKARKVAQNITFEGYLPSFPS